MKVDNLMISSGSEAYYDELFRVTLESHMAYLRHHPRTQTFSVSPHDAIVYDGDLFGFLLANRISLHLHWVCMRMSGFFGPTEFGPGTQRVLVPPEDELESIRIAHSTTGRVTL